MSAEQPSPCGYPERGGSQDVFFNRGPRLPMPLIERTLAAAAKLLR